MGSRSFFKKGHLEAVLGFARPGALVIARALIPPTMAHVKLH